MAQSFQSSYCLTFEMEDKSMNKTSTDGTSRLFILEFNFSTGESQISFFFLSFSFLFFSFFFFFIIIHQWEHGNVNISPRLAIHLYPIIHRMLMRNIGYFARNINSSPVTGRIFVASHLRFYSFFPNPCP